MGRRFSRVKMPLEQSSARAPCITVNHSTEEEPPLHDIDDRKFRTRGTRPVNIDCGKHLGHLPTGVHPRTLLKQFHHSVDCVQNNDVHTCTSDVDDAGIYHIFFSPGRSVESHSLTVFLSPLFVSLPWFMLRYVQETPQEGHGLGWARWKRSSYAFIPQPYVCVST